LSAPLQQLGELCEEGWVVGGAIRDRLLGRATTDYDFAVPGDARDLAKGLAKSADGHAFQLSDAFGAWRVIAKDRSWQIDLTPLTGDTIEQDLGNRDLTINAMAAPLHSARMIDPHGGGQDLADRVLRMVSPDAFKSDPLRALRLVRFATQLGFTIDQDTAAAAQAAAPALVGVAGERVFAELGQIIAGDHALKGIKLLDRLGILAVILPELTALRGIEQNVYHHLDVYDHTIATLAAVLKLERDPAALFGADWGEAIRSFLAEPLADELTRGTALRFGALFHDIAKSATRSVTDDGRIVFFGHDLAGAEIAGAILNRLRCSERLSSHVAALARHHLRLGFLVREAPLSPRAVYRYLATCEPVEVDVTLLSVADRLATQGKNGGPATAAHLELAGELLPAAFAWHADRPRPPIRGDRLAAAIGIEPGPELGTLLNALTEAAYVGEIASEDDAISYAQTSLSQGR
jgi:putative nucleotidyltransferase with HDIG domain